MSWVVEFSSTTPLFPSREGSRETRTGNILQQLPSMGEALGYCMHPCRAQTPCLVMPGAESRKSLSSPTHWSHEAPTVQGAECRQEASPGSVRSTQGRDSRRAKGR